MKKFVYFLCVLGNTSWDEWHDATCECSEQRGGEWINAGFGLDVISQVTRTLCHSVSKRLSRHIRIVIAGVREHVVHRFLKKGMCIDQASVISLLIKDVLDALTSPRVTMNRLWVAGLCFYVHNECSDVLGLNPWDMYRLLTGQVMHLWLLQSAEIIFLIDFLRHSWIPTAPVLNIMASFSYSGREWRHAAQV